MRFAPRRPLSPWPLAAAAPARAADVLPSREVRPGMAGRGTHRLRGRAGRRVRRPHPRAFSRTPSGPRQSLILARLEGGPARRDRRHRGHERQPGLHRRAGWWARWPTPSPSERSPSRASRPIAEMIEATRVETPRAASARFRVPADGPLAAPLDRDAVAAALAGRPLRASCPAAFAGEPRSRPRSPGPRCSPLALPLVFSGFEPDDLRVGPRLLLLAGLRPGAWVAAAPPPSPGPLPDLAPGSAVGVSLVEGDLDLSVTGTVTHIDDDRVYAFGHPFYNLGPTQLPDEEGLGLLGLPEPAGLVEDRGRPRRRGHHGPGPDDGDRRAARRGAAHDPGGGRACAPRARASAPSASAWSRTSCSRRCSPTSRCSRCSRGTSGPSAPRPCGWTPGSPSPAAARCGSSDVVASDQPAPQAAAVVAGPLALLVANDFETVQRRADRGHGRRRRDRRDARRSRGPGWTRRSRCGRGPRLAAQGPAADPPRGET